MAYPCACCGWRTRSEEEFGSYELCPVCFWEDDSVQTINPNFEGGANVPSLIQARANYEQYGASDPGSVPNVRPPNPNLEGPRVIHE